MEQTNQALRFVIELTGIITFGMWGYSLSDSAAGIVLAILFPLLFAVLWGVFAVRGDPSRSGKTVIQTPGILRLILELALFGAAISMLLDMGYRPAGWLLLVGVLLHYIISFDRILWLLKKK